MTDYEKLKGIIDEIDNLISHHVCSSAPAFEAWHTKAERFLIKKYGKDSLEHQKFLDTYFAPLVWCGEDEEQDIRDSIKWCADGLRSCKAVFETYLEDIAEESQSATNVKCTSKQGNMAKIFIVHGHDGELKQSVARIIEKQGIILKQRTGRLPLMLPCRLRSYFPCAAKARRQNRRFLTTLKNAPPHGKNRREERFCWIKHLNM